MMLTYLCFVPGGLDGPAIADLLERAPLGFMPATLRSGGAAGSRPARYGPGTIAGLREDRGVGWVAVNGLDGSLRVTGLAGWPTRLAVLTTPGWPPIELLDVASRLPGFAAALIGDEHDVFWQSTDQITTYKVHGRSLEGLHLVPDPVLGGDKVDTSGHPGRRSPAPGLWLWAAARMWFGGGAFAVVDRDRLRSLPVGAVGERDGIVTVDLYDPAAPLPDVRDAQRRFRDWMGYDELEAQAASLAASLLDPRVEVDEGSWPGGGVRRITEWLDGDRLVPRSLARSCRRTVLDAHGHVVERRDESAPATTEGKERR